MSTHVSTAKFEIEFGGEPVDVTPIVDFLDKSHKQRRNQSEPLRILVPAGPSQPKLAIATAIKYAKRWSGVLFEGMHYTMTYFPGPDEPAEFISPYFSPHDREMYSPQLAGVSPCLSVVDASFGVVGYVYEGMGIDAILTEATEARWLKGKLVRRQGASADYSHRLIVSGKYLVLVIENREQPWVRGNDIPESVVTASMRFDSDVYTVPDACKSPEMTAVFDKIADMTIDLMVSESTNEDGTVTPVIGQFGVGVGPNIIIAKGAKRLVKRRVKRRISIKRRVQMARLIARIWSEVVIDGMMELDGIPITGTLLLGSKKLHKWADGNKWVELLGVEQTNSAELINQMHNFWSVIQAMAVRLDGGTIVGKGKRHSGAGGAPDFGRSKVNRVIMLPSSHMDKAGNRVSNIVVGSDPLDHDVLLGMDHPDFVITEIGIADLRFKTADQIANALIAISHPDCRDALRQGAHDAKVFAVSRIVPPSRTESQAA